MVTKKEWVFLPTKTQQIKGPPQPVKEYDVTIEGVDGCKVRHTQWARNPEDACAHSVSILGYFIKEIKTVIVRQPEYKNHPNITFSFGYGIKVCVVRPTVKNKYKFEVTLNIPEISKIKIDRVDYIIGELKHARIYAEGCVEYFSKSGNALDRKVSV